ncbi:hypothetical protein ACIBQX_08165 [Nonomuraea sp. NPDC049714]|uniref:hypothetical protein n=1 Tax=Nonomuraea sp. NPDC049714 TaxID=3364357 RepID=UPI0037909A28
MSERRRSNWLIFASTGIALGVLSVFFLRIGTARAGEWAQIIGTLAGIAGLGVTVYSVVLMRRTTPAPSKETPGSVRNTLSGDVNGDIIQARDIGASPDDGGDRPSSAGGTTANKINGRPSHLAGLPRHNQRSLPHRLQRGQPPARVGVRARLRARAGAA